MGTILRSAEWFGIKNIILSSDCVDPYNSKVVRSAMGAHFYLNQIHQSDDLQKQILKLKDQGLEISELSTHLQGQLVASHPAYDLMFDVFAPENLHGNVKERTKWAVDQMINAINASNFLGISPMASFSGSLLFHTFYPWPQRPSGLVEEGFKELAKRWTPILDVYEDNGVDL